MLRRDTYKKGVSAADGARKREDNIVSARKNKREQSLNQRRRTHTHTGPGAFDGTCDSNKDTHFDPQSSSGIKDAAAKVFTQDPVRQLEGTRYLRKVLSIEQRPPITQVVAEAGVVDRLAQFLKNSNEPSLQFESCWVLTNIASGTSEHTCMVMNAGVVRDLVELISHGTPEVKEQAVWAIGNIAGDSHTARDHVISNGAVPPLATLLHAYATTSSQVKFTDAQLAPLRTTAWTLSNCCRGKPAPSLEAVAPALQTLAMLVESHNDPEIVTDACWALSYISDGTNDRIQAVIDADVTKRLAELLSGVCGQALVPALRTIGNIVTGSDDQTQVAINCSALLQLQKVLVAHNVHKSAILKEACWALSNVTAGTPEQIDAVIASGCMSPLIKLMSTGETDVKREAAWAISNATASQKPHQIAQLVQSGCVKPLSDLLTCIDIRVILVALEGIKNILKVGEDIDHQGKMSGNVYAVMLEDAGGLDHIEELQSHPSSEVQDKAVDLLTTFFEVLPEEENQVPDINAGGCYDFVPQVPMPNTGGFTFNDV